MGEGLGRGLDKLRSDKTQALSRLVACHEPSIYPARRPATSPETRKLHQQAPRPVGERLGRGLDKLRSDKTQALSRLVVYHEPSIYS